MAGSKTMRMYNMFLWETQMCRDNLDNKIPEPQHKRNRQEILRTI
jgi:hypothetical protein